MHSSVICTGTCKLSCLQVLQPTCTFSNESCLHDVQSITVCMQVTKRVLTELLGRHTSPDAAVTAASASAASAPLQISQAEYADAGLAELAAPNACMTLQSSMLRCIMLTVEAPKDYLYLGKHVFPICLPPFLKYAESSMDRYVRTGKAAVPLPDLRPYVMMLGMLSCRCYPHASDQASCISCDVENVVVWWMLSTCKSPDRACTAWLLVMKHAPIAM